VPARSRILIDPKVLLGKPVIRGTRVTVELVLRKLSEGATEAELLDAYPSITREDIQAALQYAADAIALERTLPLAAGTTKRSATSPLFAPCSPKGTTSRPYEDRILGQRTMRSPVSRSSSRARARRSLVAGPR
jgi:uncharacterized protein (DUF433 family)